MPLLIGFDTGGTYTDAILFDPDLGRERGILATAKALTTKHDLALGLGEALSGVLAHLPAGADPGDIALVSMSTTLATNALVEGQGAPICLILIGYEKQALERAGLGKALGGDPVVFVAGGHLPSGEAQAPLDGEAVRQAVLAFAPKVAAFAVSGYFSVRNPRHETEARAIIAAATGKPVTCGHELTSKLDAPRRALTAALNARLIPQLQQLILALEGLLRQHGILAPLMVVKGDGSLIARGSALDCPVETILSGPAASLVGALYLSGERDVLVSDMGGTTTDIAMLRDGRPVLNRDGATVGGWKTMVEAVAVHTYGIGGDSEVRLDEHNGLGIGPRRVVPLSLLAHLHPATLDALRKQAASGEVAAHRGQFALRQRPLDTEEAGLNEGQSRLWNALADGPLPLAELVFSPAAQRNLQRLIDRGLVAAAGLTPSDAAHVLGLQSLWSREAAVIGAALFLRRPAQAGWRLPPDAETLARQIVEQVVRQSGHALLDAVLADQTGIAAAEWGRLGRYLAERALLPEPAPGDLLATRLALNFPLAAIGAPAALYYPEIARRLGARLVAPRHAEVANALGAVIGGVMQKAIIAITQPSDGLYRAHLPDGPRDFPGLDEAKSAAREAAAQLAAKLAERAGAAAIEIVPAIEEKLFTDPSGLTIFLEANVIATAFGRPALS